MKSLDFWHEKCSKLDFWVDSGKHLSGFYQAAFFE